MEILIIGSIIVALMVYASTRIKRVAADAFERETITTDEFQFIKAEGFLHPLNNESEFVFYAYSKEFGKEDAEEMRQAEIFIRSFNDKNFTEACNGIKKDSPEIILEEVSGTGRTCLIESEKIVEEIAVLEFYKIIQSKDTQKIYELKISVLKDFDDDYRERIDEMLTGFRVK